jgi:hypothetical protein
MVLLFVSVVPSRLIAQDHQAHGPAHDAEIGVARSPTGVSGTAWEPEQPTMDGIHWHRGAWDLMVHGNLFAGFVLESAEDPHRRGHQITGLNWIMAMATRPLPGGSLTLRAMGSAEPWTVRQCGYPDLLATGELCDGDNVHDRQHPHDLFMELAAQYQRRLGAGLTWEVYGGPVGAPALGPMAFPHRASAALNPIAPIAHHWLDSTHIAFGVVTTGVFGQRWKAEASAFNGREPDEHRTDFDLGRLDSYSARVTIAPTPRWTLQASAGRLESAEAGVGEQPATDVTRGTLSASYLRPRGSGSWAVTVGYGVNAQRTIIPQGRLRQTSHAILAEATLLPNARDAWFGRLEIAGKPAHDLHAHKYITRVLTVGKIEAGYLRGLTRRGDLVIGAGGAATAALVGPLLAPRYGGRVAPGFAVFVNVRASSTDANAHH